MTDEIHIDTAKFSDETQVQALRSGFARTLDRLHAQGFITFTHENRDFGDESDHCHCTELRHQPDAHEFLI